MRLTKLAIFTGVPETWPLGLFQAVASSLGVTPQRVEIDGAGARNLSSFVLKRNEQQVLVGPVTADQGYGEDFVSDAKVMVSALRKEGVPAWFDESALSVGGFWLSTDDEVYLVVACLTAVEFLARILGRLEEITAERLDESLEIWRCWASDLRSLRLHWGERVVIAPYPSVVCDPSVLIRRLEAEGFEIASEALIPSLGESLGVEPDAQVRWVLDVWVRRFHEIAEIEASLFESREIVGGTRPSDRNSNSEEAAAQLNAVRAARSIPNLTETYQSEILRSEAEANAATFRAQVMGRELRESRIDLVSKIDLIRELQKKADELSEVLLDQQKRLDEAADSSVSLKALIAKKESERALNERQLKIALDGLERASLEVEEAVSKLKKCEAENASQLAEVEIRNEQSQAQVLDLVTEIADRDNQLVSVSARLRQAEMDHKQIADRIPHLEAEIELSHAAHSRTKARLEMLEKQRTEWLAESSCLQLSQQSALDASLARVKEFESAYVAADARSSALGLRYEELKTDRDLLELQLLQAQEELQESFRSRSVTQANSLNRERDFLVSFWKNHFPNDLWIDLRQEILGENWYLPEVDGRWTGPGAAATIMLPPLPTGHFHVEIEVVGLVSLLQLQGVLVGVGSERFVADCDLLSDALPCVLSAECNVAENDISMPWLLCVVVPELICPAEVGIDDQRTLGLRIRCIRITQRVA